MAMQRSIEIGNHSFSNTNGTPFVIQPEHLDIAEIRYELQLRGISQHGGRRELAASLRDCLVKEIRNGCKPLQPFQFDCPINEEFRYMRANFGALKSRLEGVNRNSESQNNYMTLWLHISGRLSNLVSKVSGGEQQTVLTYLDELNQMSAMFDQYKLRQMPTATISRPNSSSMPRVDALEQEQLRRAQQASLSGNQLQRSDQLETQLQQQLDSNQIPNTRSEPAVAFTAPTDENTVRQSVQTDGQIATQAINLQENRNENPVRVNLNQLFNIEHQSQNDNLLPVPNLDNFNATPQQGDNARLSNVFQRTDGAITPIGPEGENEQNFLRGFVSIEDVPNQSEEEQFDTHFNGNIDQPLITLPRFDSNVHNRNPREHIVNLNANANQRVNQGENRLENRSDRRTFTVNNQMTSNLAPRAQAIPNRFDGIASIPSNVNRNSREIGSRENDPIPNAGNRNDLLERTLTQMSAMMQQMQLMQEEQQAIQRQLRTQTTSHALANVNQNGYAQENPQVNPRRQNVSENHSRNSSHGSNSEQRKHSLPVHKWPFKFTGDKKEHQLERKDLTAFFKKVNIFSRSENISLDEVHQRIIHLLDGPALAWYSTYGDRFRNWEEIKSGLKSHFETNLTKFQKSQMLGRRTQRANESCMDYISAMCQLFEELDMNDEVEKVAIIQNGLRENFRWISHAQSWPTVAALDHQLRQIELSNDLRRFTPVHSHTFASEVKEVDSTEQTDERPLIDFEDSETAPLECMAVGNPRYKNLQRKSDDASKVETKSEAKSKRDDDLKQRMTNWTCFNCGDRGHGFTYCRKPINRVFCFKCGQEGVFAPDCKCQTKNV